MSMQWKDSALLSDSSLDKLHKFCDFISRWNTRINLTGYREGNEVENLLIGESVRAADALLGSGILQPGARVLDFGSGAGIPGLVWSIVELPIQVTSLEVRQKKIAFQKEVARELDLKCRILLGHFPESVASEEFDLIVSRGIRYDVEIWRAGEKSLAPSGNFVRFAPHGGQELGWEAIPVSERTALLVKGAQKRV